MFYHQEDFNGAAEYFADRGAERWSELSKVLDSLVPQLQGSDQKGKIGKPIFDPKGSNAQLTAHAATLGWTNVAVPTELQPFGKEWDGGKDAVLVEWQFSNYPFLWNNIIRSEAIFQSRQIVPPLLGPAEALVIVTKSGSFPASNSTLYYEQARAQINTVTTLGVFEIPIRLVGLSLPAETVTFECDWNVYGERYGRVAATTTRRTFSAVWGKQGQYGHTLARFL